MAIESDQLQKRYLFGQAAGGKVWDPEQRSVVLFRISDQPQYDVIIQNRSCLAYQLFHRHSINNHQSIRQIDITLYQTSLYKDASSPTYKL